MLSMLRNFNATVTGGTSGRSTNMFIFQGGIAYQCFRKRLLIQISVFSAVFILTTFYGTNQAMAQITGKAIL